MEHHPDSANAKLTEIHDLYQRRVAEELVGLNHIDLTIPSQLKVADKVMVELSLELSLFVEKDS